METRCARIKLKPGSVDDVRAWAAELNSRRDEVLATLRDEGVAVESAFFERTPEGDFLVYYMRVRSHEQARAAFEQSQHEIDAYHGAFKERTWESSENLELLIDFENPSA